MIKKFEAWDNKNKEMIDMDYPTYSASPDCDFMICDLQWFFGCLQSEDSMFADGDRRYELRQSTGHFDKNKKEVYEGDLVKYLELLFVVRIGKYGVMFNDPHSEKTHYNYLLPINFPGELPKHYIVDTGNYEIVGNIYKNKDLKECELIGLKKKPFNNLLKNIKNEK